MVADRSRGPRMPSPSGPGSCSIQHKIHSLYSFSDASQLYKHCTNVVLDSHYRPTSESCFLWWTKRRTPKLQRQCYSRKHSFECYRHIGRQGDVVIIQQIRMDCVGCQQALGWKGYNSPHGSEPASRFETSSIVMATTWHFQAKKSHYNGLHVSKHALMMKISGEELGKLIEGGFRPCQVLHKYDEDGSSSRVNQIAAPAPDPIMRDKGLVLRDESPRAPKPSENPDGNFSNIDIRSSEVIANRNRQWVKTKKGGRTLSYHFIVTKKMKLCSINVAHSLTVDPSFTDYIWSSKAMTTDKQVLVPIWQRCLRRKLKDTQNDSMPTSRPGSSSYEQTKYRAR